MNFETLNLLANQNPVITRDSQEEESNQTEAIINDNNNKNNNNDDDWNKEANDRKTDDLINEFKSESMTPSDNNMLSRRSISSGQLINDQASSTPNTTDQTKNHNNHGPTEQTSTIPIQQDERSINGDDSSSVQEAENNQLMTNDQTNRITSATQANDLDETTRFTPASSKLSTTRIQSATSKKSQPVVTDDKIVKQSDEIHTDTEDTKQGIQSSSRASSRTAKSPLNWSRTPASDESRKTPTNIETQQEKSPLAGEQTSSSPRTRTSKTTQNNTNTSTVDQSSRSSSAMKSKFNDNKSESSTTQLNNDFSTGNMQADLIKQGEQIQIPTIDNDDEQANDSVESKRNGRNSTSSSRSNEETIDGDTVASKRRRSSYTSQQEKPIIKDQQSNLTSSRRESNASEQKLLSTRQSTVSEQKSIIEKNSSDQQEKKSSRPSSRKSSPVEQQPTDSSRRTSASRQERILSSDKQQLTTQSRSGQHSRTNSHVVAPIRTGSTKSQQNEKPSSMTESDHENLTTSKLARANSSAKQNESRHSTGKKISSSSSTTPRRNSQTSQPAQKVLIPPLNLTDDEIPSSRSLSPNIEQLVEHNPVKVENKDSSDEEKTNDQQKLLHRSNSVESLNAISSVDGQSIDSTSDFNTGSERQKQKRIKSKKIDVETNTDKRTDAKNNTRQNVKRQQESTPQKPMKATKSIVNQFQNNRRVANVTDRTSTTTDTDRDKNVRQSQRSNKEFKNDKDPLNINVTVPVKNSKDHDNSQAPSVAAEQKSPKKQDTTQSSEDFERHTQSDTEQIKTEKQRKRRRPKRISRTTQTYECVFRRMECEEHEELRPTNDTEKNIQTRKSQLCPRSRSPRKPPTLLTTEAFKIEEILPKQFPQSQQNSSKTAMIARNVSPQNGKLLILRPTLPFHHTDAVNVQRVCLQYAIDLVPTENKLKDSPYAQRNKINNGKQMDHTHSLPMLHSSVPLTGNASIGKTNSKDKTAPGKIEDRASQRKNGGAV